MLIKTTKAQLVWKALNGVFAVYKPAEVHIKTVKSTVIDRLCQDMNELDGRPPMDYVAIEGDTTKELSVTKKASFADHPLVVGPRYQHKDFKLSWTNYLRKDTCGIVVVGLNDATWTIKKLKNSKPTSFYRLRGTLGYATDTYFKTGKIVERSGYKFIHRPAIDKVCASMQSSHQRKMFEACGIDIQSQAAFELAAKGPIRPADPKIPMIYSIKCIDFDPPDFTLEIVCVNEYEMYLKSLVHEVGMQLHSVATCTQVQCFQYGLFGMDLALLKKHWNLQDILDNMHMFEKIISKNKHILYQDSPVLREGVAS